MNQDNGFELQRASMVDYQLRARGIESPLVLEAMGRLVKTGPAAANFDAVWSAGARGAGFHGRFGAGTNFVLAGPL